MQDLLIAIVLTVLQSLSKECTAFLSSQERLKYPQRLLKVLYYLKSFMFYYTQNTSALELLPGGFG